MHAYFVAEAVAGAVIRSQNAREVIGTIFNLIMRVICNDLAPQASSQQPFIPIRSMHPVGVDVEVRLTQGKRYVSLGIRTIPSDTLCHTGAMCTKITP